MDHKRWGVIEIEDLDEEEEIADDDAEMEPEDEEDRAAFVPPSAVAQSIDSHAAAPEPLQLRKSGVTSEVPESRSLYTVLEQKDVNVGRSAFASSHTYSMPGDDLEERRRRMMSQAEGTMSVDPSSVAKRKQPDSVDDDDDDDDGRVKRSRADKFKF